MLALAGKGGATTEQVPAECGSLSLEELVHSQASFDDKGVMDVPVDMDRHTVEQTHDEQETLSKLQTLFAVGTKLDTTRGPRSKPQGQQDVPGTSRHDCVWNSSLRSGRVLQVATLISSTSHTSNEVRTHIEDASARRAAKAIAET